MDVVVFLSTHTHSLSLSHGMFLPLLKDFAIENFLLFVSSFFGFSCFFVLFPFSLYDDFLVGIQQFLQELF